MTVFYFSGDETCAKIKKAFDFFDDIKIVSIEDSVSSLDTFFSDEQIGFIVPCRNHAFPAEVRELIGKTTPESGYFFSIIADCGNSSDAARKFKSMCEKSGISLKYLNSLFSREDDDEISEKAIGFRNEIALFVSRINGVTAGNRFFGLFEKMKSKINA